MTTQLNNSVLVAGAGPTGLILAFELRRRGVPVRLIEKRQGPSHTSRAITIQARSMEMFDHMGLAHRLQQVCLECPGNIYHFPGIPYDELPRTDYRVLPTRFAFYYKISQNDFEQILREHVFAYHSLRPEYRTELVEVVQESDSVLATIRLPSGDLQEERFPYVVGCDGVRSRVRDAAGIPFVGGKIGVMAMMDVPLTNVTFDDRWMNYYFNQEVFMNCTKMPGPYWRIYMSEPDGKYVYAEDQQRSFQEVADKLDIGFRVGEPAWATAWEIRNNVAEKYRERRIIICGDASHVHSPTGGQGMNGCMQDAFNLGWKLAAVFKGDCDEAILDSYERERKPIGEQISKGSLATHTIVMGFDIPLADRLPMTKVPNWEADTIKLVSGLSHNYREVTKLPKGITSLPGPQAGERAPDALLVSQPRRYLYDSLRRPHFTVLVVPSRDGNHVQLHIQYGLQLRNALHSHFPGHASTYLISNSLDTGFDFDHRSQDEHNELAERYQIGPEGRLLVVRPDLYLGLVCLPGEWERIPEYFDQWFHRRVR